MTTTEEKEAKEDQRRDVAWLAARWAASERFYAEATLGSPSKVEAIELEMRTEVIGVFGASKKENDSNNKDDNPSQDDNLAKHTENLLWKLLDSRSKKLKERTKQTQNRSPDTQNGSRQDDLMIDSQWLRLYLLLRVLRIMRRCLDVSSHMTDLRCIVWPNDRTGHFSRIETRAELFLQVSRFARDTLRFEVEGTGRSAGIDIVDYARAMIYLTSLVAHEELGLPRDLDVLGHLSTFLDHELQLHLGKQYYRDHAFHVIDTFLFGLMLIELRKSNDNGRGKLTLAHTLLNSTSTKNKGMSIKDSEIWNLKANWALASLFHDFGYLLEISLTQPGDYPFSRSNPWNDITKRLCQHERDHHGFINRSISCDKSDLVGPKWMDSAKSEMEQQLEGKDLDHGLVSGWYLHHRLIQLPDGSKTLERWRTALDAVLLHNLFNAEIDWDNQPVAGLLAFCDEVQEWDRHRIDGPPFAVRSLVAAKFEHPMELPLKGRVRGIRLSKVKFPEIKNGNSSTELDNRWLTLEEERKVRCEVEYREPENLRTPTEIIWLSKTWNLQRIKTIAHDVEVLIFTHVDDGLKRLDLYYQRLLAIAASRNASKEIALLIRPWVLCNHWKPYPLFNQDNPLPNQDNPKPPPVEIEEITLQVCSDPPRYLDRDPRPHFRTLRHEIERIVSEQRVVALKP